MTTPAELVERMRAARDEFYSALEGIAPESHTTPGLVGEWSAREVIAHLGYWAGYAAERIHAAQTGGGDVDRGGRSVDEINDTVARVALGTDLATVRKREAAAFEALVERVASLEPEVPDVDLAGGSTLEDVVRDDGYGHYAEHAEELRRILAERPRG